jgi:hypothetical protein
VRKSSWFLLLVLVIYTTTKNKRTKPEKLELKIDPVVRQSTYYTKKLKSNNFRFDVKKKTASAGFFVFWPSPY